MLPGPLVALLLGLRLAGAGLLAGAVVGWLGLIFAEGAVAVGVFCGRGYLLLALLLPAVLVVVSVLEPAVFDPLRRLPSGWAVSGVLLAGAVLGSTMGTLSFVVGALVIPSTFGGEDSWELVEVIRSEILWLRVWIVGSVTTLLSLMRMIGIRLEGA